MINLLVFLFFFLLPVGWAKHWLIPASSVNGVLVDYLMPDIWVQDLLAIMVIIANLPFIIKHWSLWVKKLWPLLLFLPGLVLSPSPLVSLVYFLRFVLVLSTGCLLFILFKDKKKGMGFKKWALSGLAGAVIWTTILAVMQLINQKTVFGWRFLGEPFFGLGSGGVKKIEVFGRLLLTPMGTFPHSNVLGGFGLLSFLVFADQRKSWQHNLILILSAFCAVFSFSVIVWFLLLCLIVSHYFTSIDVKYNIFSFKIKKDKFGVFGVVTPIILCLSFFVLLLKFGFLPPSSVFRRWQLAKISLLVIRDHPFFGVGWGCFVKELPRYWQEIGSPIRFLQPVHNLFLLMLSEVGIIGLGGLLLLFKDFLKKMFSSKFLLLTSCFLILSFFDHYFWTTTQGIYLLLLLLLAVSTRKP
ncbi:MAG: O-antigen ligase family protein [Patescibacteria group bacterium]